MLRSEVVMEDESEPTHSLSVVPSRPAPWAEPSFAVILVTAYLSPLRRPKVGGIMLRLEHGEDQPCRLFLSSLTSAGAVRWQEREGKMTGGLRVGGLERGNRSVGGRADSFDLST